MLNVHQVSAKASLGEAVSWCVNSALSVRSDHHRFRRSWRVHPIKRRMLSANHLRILHGRRVPAIICPCVHLTQVMMQVIRLA